MADPRRTGAGPGSQWTEFADVVAVLRRRWSTGAWLSAAAQPNPTWEPLALPLRGPTVTELAGQFDRVRDWVSRWRKAEKSGLRLEYHSVGGRSVGTNQLPRRVWLDEADQAFRALGVRDQVGRFVDLVGLERNRAPRLVDWMLANPLQVLSAEAEWDLLVSIVLWIDRHGTPVDAAEGDRLYLRQIDVPGVDTKFIEERRGLLSRLLDAHLDPARVDLAWSRSEFTKRYGFRSKPDQVRFRFLDGTSTHGRPGGFSELTVRTDELAGRPLAVSTVYAVENEITYLAFPPVPDSVVFFGGGYAVSRLAPLHWLSGVELHYWGDLDTHGFAILSRLRRHFPHTRSMLMNRRTLLEHEGQWVREPVPTTERLALLDAAEADLYQDLVENSFGPAVRLEQERIRFSAIERSLRCGEGTSRIPSTEAPGARHHNGHRIYPLSP
jgi:hypothetical protein